jgi:hypothetical protein
MRDLHITRDGQLLAVYLDDRAFQIRDPLDFRQVVAEIRDKSQRFHEKLTRLPEIRRVLNEGAVGRPELNTAVDTLGACWVRSRAGL